MIGASLLVGLSEGYKSNPNNESQKIKNSYITSDKVKIIQKIKDMSNDKDSEILTTLYLETNSKAKINKSLKKILQYMIRQITWLRNVNTKINRKMYNLRSVSQNLLCMLFC